MSECTRVSHLAARVRTAQWGPANVCGGCRHAAPQRPQARRCACIFARFRCSYKEARMQHAGMRAFAPRAQLASCSSGRRQDVELASACRAPRRPLRAACFPSRPESATCIEPFCHEHSRLAKISVIGAHSGAPEACTAWVSRDLEGPRPKLAARTLALEVDLAIFWSAIAARERATRPCCDRRAAGEASSSALRRSKRDPRTFGGLQQRPQKARAGLALSAA